jgi:multiple sugar transport system substrate-binding protein
MTDIVYAMVGDTSDLWEGLVQEFHPQHQDDTRVRLEFRDWNIAPYLDELREMFRRRGTDIHVIVGDVIWSAEFASEGWIADLSPRFPRPERWQFLNAAIKVNTYNRWICGVPLYTDVGLLYYRKDLLDQSGFFCPAKTWDQLKQMALQVKQDSDDILLEHGYVFPGAEDDSGVYNGLEYIWTRGGAVCRPVRRRVGHR